MKKTNSEVGALKVRGFKTRDDITTLTGLKKGRPKHFIPAAQQEFDLKSRKNISDDGKRKERARLLRLFPNMLLKEDRLYSLTTLDQDEDGACTIASLFNLMNIVGKNGLHGGMTWAKIKNLKNHHGTYFGKQVYDKIIKGLGRHVEDYQETFDRGAKLKIPVILNVLKDQSFRYVPIRSRDYREAYFNRGVVGDKASEILTKIKKYIESRIDHGIPVGVSSNGHARVIVGYNDKDIVMLDSWGDNYAVEQKEVGTGAQRYQDKFKAGFSVLNKMVMYGDVRDLIYFEPTEKDSVNEAVNAMQLKLKL